MSDNLELVGFYDISQLASRRETERQKQHIGILPWSKSKIEKMLRDGKFPKPLSDGYRKIWPKRVIHEFIENIISEAGNLV